MQTLQQKVMCVLLQTLLDQGLITQPIHDRSRQKILATWDWPDFLSGNQKDGKEALGGSE